MTAGSTNIDVAGDTRTPWSDTDLEVDIVLEGSSWWKDSEQDRWLYAKSNTNHLYGLDPLAEGSSNSKFKRPTPWGKIEAQDTSIAIAVLRIAPALGHVYYSYPGSRSCWEKLNNTYGAGKN